MRWKRATAVHTESESTVVYEAVQFGYMVHETLKFEYAKANTYAVYGEAESLADLFGSVLGCAGRKTDRLCVGIVVMLLPR